MRFRSGRAESKTVTPQSAAAAVQRPVRELDIAWSTCPQTLRRARLLELSGWAFYVGGRGGVLGDDARADTVAASIGLISPDAAQAGWDAARKVGPVVVAACRLAECARWGSENLDPVPGVDRLVTLAARVVDAAEAVAMPIFAAARAVPQPDGTAGAKAALLIHLLQEQRAAATLVATTVCGLTPVEALIAGPDGEEEALTFGWRPPFPARTPLMRRYLYAEAIADRICGRAWTGLTGPERADLVRLLLDAAGHWSPAGQMRSTPGRVPGSIATRDR